ncbi:hypothetical protein ACLKMY_37000 [Paraburkholderia mimosarum]|uniref:hypothetical protein n=1 Tax=Paraburkholderia mimosarum TaxID=312026 RepID=UPI0012B5AA99|nr:hypothetical protein [Paraburkholderia mimosarum]
MTATIERVVQGGEFVFDLVAAIVEKSARLAADEDFEIRFGFGQTRIATSMEDVRAVTQRFTDRRHDRSETERTQPVRPYGESPFPTACDDRYVKAERALVEPARVPVMIGIRGIRLRTRPGRVCGNRLRLRDVL